MSNEILRRFGLSAVFPELAPDPMGLLELCDHPNDPEAPENVKDFIGVSWIQVDSDFWFQRESAISYFSDRACVYFVPSIVAASKIDFDSIELVVGAVIREWAASEEAMIRRANRRWSGLTQLQRGFLIGWVMDIKIKRINSILDRDILRAIEFLAGKII